MLDVVFNIVAAVALLGTAGAVSLKLAAMMVFGDSIKLSAAFVISIVASLAAVSSLILVSTGHVENSVAVFVPGLVFAVSSWLLGILVSPFERTEGWRMHSKAFLITMAQCIGVTVVSAAVSSVFIVSAWMVAAII